MNDSWEKSQNPKNFIPLKQSDIIKLKEELHTAQNNICPILKKEFPLEDMVVDHVHKRKQMDEPNEENGGLVRGAINRYANIMLGKIENSWRRTGLENQGYDLPSALRAMADFLEQEPLPYIHPSEKIPHKKVMKSCFNKLIKEMKKQEVKRLPLYPRTGKLTKKLESLFEKYEIPIEFY